jgi:hypothetical protein
MRKAPEPLRIATTLVSTGNVVHTCGRDGEFAFTLWMESSSSGT